METRSLSAVAVLVASLSGCGSTAAPAAGRYEIDFPTIAAAVDSHSVAVYAFDPAASCDDLLADVPSGSFPAVTYQAAGLVCDLREASGGSLSLPFGTYSIVVVLADASGNIVLDGCTTQTISEAEPSVVVSVQVASDSVSIPVVPTTCTLAAHCQGQAGC